MESLGDILRRLQQRNFSNAVAAVPDWVQQLDVESAVVEDPCPTCGGQGWVRRDVPVGHPDFGRAFPCLCQVQPQRVQTASHGCSATAISGCSMPLTFETLAPSGPGVGPEANARYDAALRASHAPSRREPVGSLLLTGGHGTGKTCLAAAAANHLMAAGPPRALHLRSRPARPASGGDTPTMPRSPTTNCLSR